MQLSVVWIVGFVISIEIRTNSKVRSTRNLHFLATEMCFGMCCGDNC